MSTRHDTPPRCLSLTLSAPSDTLHLLFDFNTLRKTANHIMGNPAEEMPSFATQSYAGEPVVVLPKESIEERSAALAQLFGEWLADKSGYDEETFPQLKEALEETRRSVSAQPLFHD